MDRAAPAGPGVVKMVSAKFRAVRCENGGRAKGGGRGLWLPEMDLKPPRRVLFTFWGRRGALAQFALELAQAAQTRSDIEASFSISRQNELLKDFAALNGDIGVIDTFDANVGAALELWRIPGLRRHLARQAEVGRYEAIIELIPHVWSPLLIPPLRRSGARYATIIHDAAAHPGDWTAKVKPILDLPLRSADRVLTLSQSVADALLAQRRVSPSRLRVLSHPDLTYGARPPRARPEPGEPFKLLFLGRIMAYKGLPLFVEAAERLRAQNFPVELMVYGEGPLGSCGPRLAALGAEVVNRWLAPHEIGAALSRAHAVALPYVEASQSGVAAAAYGAGAPIVATPVGGLAEQVADGEWGVLAEAATADAFAAAVRRLFETPKLYECTLSRLAGPDEARSMARFLGAALEAATDGGSGEPGRPA